MVAYFFLYKSITYHIAYYAKAWQQPSSNVPFWLDLNVRFSRPGRPRLEAPTVDVSRFWTNFGC
jgi:hypothetical protein